MSVDDCLEKSAHGGKLMSLEEFMACVNLLVVEFEKLKNIGKVVNLSIFYRFKSH